MLDALIIVTISNRLEWRLNVLDALIIETEISSAIDLIEGHRNGFGSLNVLDALIIETSENTHGSNELSPMTARARRVDHRDTAQSPLARL